IADLSVPGAHWAADLASRPAQGPALPPAVPEAAALLQNSPTEGKDVLENPDVQGSPLGLRALLAEAAEWLPAYVELGERAAERMPDAPQLVRSVPELAALVAELREVPLVTGRAGSVSDRSPSATPWLVLFRSGWQVVAVAGAAGTPFTPAAALALGRWL